MNNLSLRERKTGRNALCSCASGKKYKHCCLKHNEIKKNEKANNNRILAESLQLAISAHQASQLHKAEELYRFILTKQPNHSDALHLLGLIAFQKGSFDAAVASINKAIQASPSIAIYYNSLGVVRRAQGKLDESMECYRKALSIDSDYVEAHNNMGGVLEDLEKPNQALECYQSASRIKPDYAEAYSNIATILKKQGRADAAFQYYQKALEIKPVLAEAYDGLASLMLEQGKQAQALAYFERGLAFNPSHAGLYHSYIFAVSRVFDDDGVKVYEACKRFGRQFQVRSLRYIHRNDTRSDRRLRVGYVSADFREHSIAYLIEPILANHDKRHVETYCYYNYHRVDEVSRRLMQHADHWRSILGLSDEEAEQLIRQDEIDVLVDLSGHTGGNRLLLFARKPAPVQVTWLGHPATTGLSAMDYRLTDRYADPPGWNEGYHTENLIHLSSSACFQAADDLPEVNSLPALTNGHLTFASFHVPDKITPVTISLWARLLGMLPEARLLLCPDNTKDHLIREFRSLGVSEERLDFLPKQPLVQYLTLHHRVDVMLDTLPYNGAIVSRHALWMGVPVLTLAGRRAVSRTGLSLMTVLGLESFVAENETDFISNACRWANDLDALARLRKTLREKMQNAPFSNAGAKAKELEAAYRHMWTRWCEQQN